MSYWFQSKFEASPLEVLSDPYSLYLGFLPQFYKSFLYAWCDLDGSFSVSRNLLVFNSSLCPVCSPVSFMSTKVCYQYLLSESLGTPHCAMKFASTFGALYWSTT